MNSLLTTIAAHDHVERRPSTPTTTRGRRCVPPLGSRPSFTSRSSATLQPEARRYGNGGQRQFSRHRPCRRRGWRHHSGLGADGADDRLVWLLQGFLGAELLIAMSARAAREGARTGDDDGLDGRVGLRALRPSTMPRAAL